MAFLGQLPGSNTLGARLGSDLGQTLQTLAGHKANQMQTRQLEKVGFPKELASIFHTLSPDVQKGIWSQINLGNVGTQQEPVQQQMQPQAPTYTPEQINMLKSIPDSAERNRFAQQFQQQNQQQQQVPISSQPSQQFGQAANQQQIAQQLASQQNPSSIFKGRGISNTAQESNDLKRENNESKKKQQINELEEKKQNVIDKKYSKITEQFEKEYNLGSQLEIIGNQLSELNKKIGDSWGPGKEGLSQGVNKLSFGLVNAPALVGEAGEQFRTKSNEIVNLLSNSIRGIPSKFRVQILEASKPSLNQSYGARTKNIQDLIKKAKAMQAPFEIQQQIVEHNGGKLPSDFSQRALPQIEKVQREILSGGGLSKLPNAKDANPDKGYLDDKNGKVYKVVDGKWVVHKE